MSDPIAVSILAKLTSWYRFDGDITDAQGTNNITVGTSVAGYAAGIKGQEIMAGSRGAAALAHPFVLSMTGSLCIGGWLDYNGSPTATSVFSVGYDFGATNEALYINSDTAGNFSAGSWSASPTQYAVSAQGRHAKKYPFTVNVRDQDGNIAISNQVISINTGSMQNGRYFIVAMWVNGLISLYIDGTLAGTVQAASPRGANVAYLQIGNQFSSSNTPCGLDECFFCDSAALTQAEINWLYNSDLGRSYGELLAAAA